MPPISNPLDKLSHCTCCCAESWLIALQILDPLIPTGGCRRSALGQSWPAPTTSCPWGPASRACSSFCSSCLAWPCSRRYYNLGFRVWGLGSCSHCRDARLIDDPGSLPCGSATASAAAVWRGHAAAGTTIQVLGFRIQGSHSRKGHTSDGWNQVWWTLEACLAGLQQLLGVPMQQHGNAGLSTCCSDKIQGLLLHLCLSRMRHEQGAACEQTLRRCQV